MSEKNTLTILGVLTSAFPNAKITPETIRVYLLTLQDIPFEVLEQAALQLITTSSFFPTVAELRDVSFRILLGTRSIPSANQAWEEVQHELYHITAYLFTKMNSINLTFHTLLSIKSYSPLGSCS